MGSKLVRGIYRSGVSHAQLRPKFYASLGLWQGTINVQLPVGTEERLIIPTVRVPGRDPFDLNENQDFLIRACRLKGVSGYQILTIDKTTNVPRGHHSEKVIEIALKEKIDITLYEMLDVELEGFES